MSTHKDGILRKSTREILGQAGGYGLTLEYLVSAIEAQSGVRPSKTAVEDALEWNHQRGFVSLKWNEEQEVNLWHITAKGRAEIQAQE